MSKTRLLTDSNAYLSSDLLQSYDIEVVPHHIRLGEHCFMESIDWDVEEFFDLLNTAQRGGFNGLPSLQAPEINTFLKHYQHASKSGGEIVAIHMSSHLSPMWNQSRRTAELLRGRYTIRVLDSLSTSVGLGILVERAARAAQEGADVHEIARLVNGAAPHLYFTCFTESLGYLEHSANLGTSQSMLGSMLGIKAMLSMEEGELIPVEKVQTREEVVDKLYDYIVEFSHIEQVGIVQHRYDSAEAELMERLNESMPDLQLSSLPYPPTLAAHLGPNAIGVIVYEGT